MCAPIRRVHTSLPSQGRISVMEQKAEKRYVAHVLYVNTIVRGMKCGSSVPGQRDSSSVEVIEELNPVYDVKLSLRLGHKITKVTLEPEGKEIPFKEHDGCVEVTLDKVVCHQMVVLHY